MVFHAAAGGAAVGAAESDRVAVDVHLLEGRGRSAGGSVEGRGRSAGGSVEGRGKFEWP